jgi:hypothetical protein
MIIKPKYKIGDEVYYISHYTEKQHEYCKECKRLLKENTITKFYYNNDKTAIVSGIRCNFEDGLESVEYTLAEEIIHDSNDVHDDNNDYSDEYWNKYYYTPGVVESDVFLNYDKIQKECKKRNNNIKEGK